MPTAINQESSIVNRPLASDRHFAWQLFSAGPAVRRNGKELHEVPVAVAGAWIKGGQKFSITADDLADMVRNFDKRKNDMVVIDYEHASEQPQVAQGGPVPAAGWIHSLSVVRGSSSVVKGNGQRATDQGQVELRALVEWTPEAKRLIEAGQYRFFSPAIDWGARDKETGQPQGATLTSGALTNHPFLEELPPIMLTDLDVEDRHAKAETPAATGRELQGPSSEFRNEGEKPMLKRLSIKRLTEGEMAGHHGIFYGDDLVGYMTDEDFAKYAQMHLPRSGNEPQASMSELCSEAGADSVEELRLKIAGWKSAAVARQAETAQAAARALLLAEAVRDGQLQNERAAALAREQKITLADYIAVEEAQKMLDQAVAQGKILPRDRRFFFRDALERPREFAEFVNKAVPVVRLGSEGIGSGEQIPVDQEVDLGVRRLMSEQKVSYGKALKLLFRENPALETRYRQAHSRPAAQESIADSGVATSATL